MIGCIMEEYYAAVSKVVAEEIGEYFNSAWLDNLKSFNYSQLPTIREYITE